MKVDAFITPNEATRTYGDDYVAHAECDGCRYVLRSTDQGNYMVFKEYAADGAVVFEQEGDPFSADMNELAVMLFVEMLGERHVAIKKLVAASAEELLN